jgi:hypothetical protein
VATAFCARIWELYLHECFRQLGFGLERQRGGGVDFVLRSLWERFAVEAVTANRSASSPYPGHAIEHEQAHDILAIRIGSSLTSKLAKRYWERDAIKDLPLVFAIEPFFDDEVGCGSTVSSRT